jgi:hypothetical protein
MRADACLARAIHARFDLVAGAYGECRASHLGEETHVAAAVSDLSARLARVEALVEALCCARARGKKIGPHA